MGRWGWILCGTLAGLFVAYEALESAWSYGVFQHVPATHDPRLVGRWTGKSEFNGHQPIEFRSDGTASTPFASGAKAEWGTSRGVLYIKQRSAGEGYNLARKAYEVGKGGLTVRTESGRWSFMIPETMTRRP